MTELGAAAHAAWRSTQLADFGSQLERVHVITTLGPVDRAGILVVADKVIGTGGLRSWSFTTAGPIWAPA